MTWKIDNDVVMRQTLEGLSDMYEILLSLRREVEPQNPKNFAILAQGPMREIRELLHELDEYTGVAKARQLLAHKPRRKAVARRSRRHAGAR